MTAPPAYATPVQFRSFVRDTSNEDLATITQALLSASRKIEQVCGRHFYQTTETQFFSPQRNKPWLLDLDDMDIATTTGLVVAVQWANESNYGETWTINTDFVPEPRNQSVAGIDGWPYTTLRSLAKLWPPQIADFYLDTVKVTGTFGWAAVPDPIVHATLILAGEIYKSGDAIFGVAGFDNFGAVRVRENPMVASLLQPYKKANTLMVA